MFDTSNPIPVPLRDLLAIFREQLPDIRFGNIDKASLEEAASRVEEAAQQAADAQAALDTARADLASSQQALLITAQRALAYARIYAETSPQLFARLQTVNFNEAATSVSKPREFDAKLGRRRVRKDAAEDMPALPGTVAEASELAVSPS